MTIPEIVSMMNPGSLSPGGYILLMPYVLFYFAAPLVAGVFTFWIASERSSKRFNKKSLSAALAVTVLFSIGLMPEGSNKIKEQADPTGEHALSFRNVKNYPSELLSEAYGIKILNEPAGGILFGGERDFQAEKQLITPDTLVSNLSAEIDGEEYRITVETIGQVYRLHYFKDGQVIKIEPLNGDAPLEEKPQESTGKKPGKQTPPDNGFYQKDS